jgi:hypothetical protein
MSLESLRTCIHCKLPVISFNTVRFGNTATGALWINYCPHCKQPQQIPSTSDLPKPLSENQD